MLETRGDADEDEVGGLDRIAISPSLPYVLYNLVPRASPLPFPWCERGVLLFSRLEGGSFTSRLQFPFCNVVLISASHVVQTFWSSFCSVFREAPICTSLYVARGRGRTTLSGK